MIEEFVGSFGTKTSPAVLYEYNKERVELNSLEFSTKVSFNVAESNITCIP